MKTPNFIVLDAIEELGILDSYLGMYEFKPAYTDKVLREVYACCRSLAEASLLFEQYIEKFRREELQYGEVLEPWIRKMFTSVLSQLCDKLIFQRDGTLPYQYERRMENRTIILSLKGMNRGLVTYHLSGLPA